MANKPGIRKTPLAELVHHPDNPRSGNIPAIVESIQTNGWYGTLVAQCSSSHVLVGNHRLQAAALCGIDKVPVQWIDCDDQTALRILLADNRIPDLATYDQSILTPLLATIAEGDTLAGTGWSDEDLVATLAAGSTGAGGDLADILGGSGSSAPIPAPTLAERFLAPPFSVLDARQGYWRSRKQEWLSLGMQSEVGRAANLLQMSDSILMADNGIDPFADRGNIPNQSMPGSVSGNTPAFFYKKQEMEALAERELSSAEAVEVLQSGTLIHANGTALEFDAGEMWAGAGTSIFDPVLCEIAYRWWCKPGGLIIDPFAGGSVRGIVAGKLGYSYFGVDLRGEQIEANRQQAKEILGRSRKVKWQQGDSTDPLSWNSLDAGSADLVFTCPPYYDLEVYSDDPADLSNCETAGEFFDLLTAAFREADDYLADDRFAVVVMGEVRDKDGTLHDMIGRTNAAAKAVGWDYYNDAILLTSVGSLALRAGRIFKGGRKLARSHQYVLVYVKGDWRKAHEACGSLDDLTLELEA